MSVADLNSLATGSSGPAQRAENPMTQPDAEAPAEFEFTRVVPVPGRILRGAVQSSLSTYLKLMHNMGILRFAEDQVIVTGWRKWARGVSFIKY